MRRLLGVLLLVCCATPLLAQSRKTMPLLVAKARFVMVTTYYGSNVLDSRITPEDRQAVADVEDAIQKWKHYQLAYRKSDADIILVVRRGRVGSVSAGVGIHRDPQGRRSLGPIVAAETGPADDMIDVYDASTGIHGAPLWLASMKDGLESPDLKLFKEFQTAVEQALKKKP